MCARNFPFAWLFGGFPSHKRRCWLVRFLLLTSSSTWNFSPLSRTPCKWLLIFPKTARAKYIGNFIIFYGAPEKDVKHIWNFSVRQRRKRAGKKESTFSGDLSCDPFISVDLTREEEKLDFSLTLREKRRKRRKKFLFFHSTSFAGDHHSRSFISFFFARRFPKKETYTQHSAIFARKHK